MDQQTSQIHDIVNKASHTKNESERKKYVEQANKIHELSTGHSMKIDSLGNIETNSEEAKACPALN